MVLLASRLSPLASRQASSCIPRPANDSRLHASQGWTADCRDALLPFQPPHWQPWLSLAVLCAVLYPARCTLPSPPVLAEESYPIRAGCSGQTPVQPSPVQPPPTLAQPEPVADGDGRRLVVPHASAPGQLPMPCHAMPCLAWPGLAHAHAIPMFMPCSCHSSHRARSYSRYLRSLCSALPGPALHVPGGSEGRGRVAIGSHPS
ncbi:hypothetical protein JHW43_003023 [Diplocarpon mali]|nr:hypothetical protein JHW43_003023 [Diplocarpon mali]